MRSEPAEYFRRSHTEREAAPGLGRVAVVGEAAVTRESPEQCRYL